MTNTKTPSKNKAIPQNQSDLPEIDYAFLEDFLVRLLNKPSPTGYAQAAIELLEQELSRFQEVKFERTRKGALLVTLSGLKAGPGPLRGLTAHVDTLGGMVKQIKGNGRLELTQIGGFAWGSVEGEGCLVHTRKQGSVRGSLLPIKASVHVYADARDEKRTNASMEVRLDARVTNAEETRALGIEVGDFVSFDPRVEVANGFVRSRHLDDKAAVATLIAAIEALHRSGLKPALETSMLFTNYEEVGLGGSSDVPESVREFVAVDMAAIGDGQNSDEFHASLCLKDAGGPYHHALSNKLRDLGDRYQIPYKTDIYVHYGSDAGAYAHAGGAAATALIGPGVDSSHHYERTHRDALIATAQWILAYLLNE
ncbi:MAG TPA: M42 family metallopeptidase [Anaerolineaceae bacterium]|nr:M42 family metallopeptidase [Anaerolineaceae bacterium]